MISYQTSGASGHCGDQFYSNRSYISSADLVDRIYQSARRRGSIVVTRVYCRFT